MSLNAAQMAFLRFHAETPAPHSWEWLDAEGRRSPSPAAAATLRAGRHKGPGLVYLQISADDLVGLRPYWTAPLQGINAEGKALLAAQAEAG